LIYHDVIVVGSGLAGQRAALEAINNDVDVAIISKLKPMNSHSVLAQGGINIAIDDLDQNNYFEDTIKGSDYLADQDSVEILVNNSKHEIEFIENIERIFDRNNDGEYSPKKFGGAITPRTLRASDSTGFSILNILYDQLLNSKVKIYEDYQVLKLITNDEQISGFIGLNYNSTNSNCIELFSCKSLVLATGPSGYVFSNTTNSSSCTGDGIALAVSAGAKLKDMEFIQFHPTSLVGSNILITEAARAKGAYLLNSDGERFMKNYAPEQLELAPRDIISRSMIKEIIEGRSFSDLNEPYLHLSFTHFEPEFIKNNFNDIQIVSREFANTDITKHNLKIVPAQHYFMGGISINNSAESNVKGLFAAGECACVSVHGANRLGGNSLLECIVFGQIAGRSAAIFSKNSHKIFITDEDSHISKFNKELSECFTNSSNNNILDISSLRNDMRSIMTTYAGIIRDENNINLGLMKIHNLKNLIHSNQFKSKSSHPNISEISEFFELSFMIELSEIILLSALNRKESRGAHFRSDYSSRNDNDWLKHIIIQKINSTYDISYSPVRITTLNPDVRNY
tara:strand:+ start:17880 stop:19586 length:1707 start_codon:yes stop_codon:yes gene_type:complete